MRARPLFMFCLAVLAARPDLQAIPPQSPAKAPSSSVVIVELFTSEGCSSCPPADALLSKVHLKETSAGQLVVGISEHVTYWNHLGWTDPYSSQVFTDRQSTYASRLSPEGPYTPQMVVDGRDQFVGSDGSALLRALDQDTRHSRINVRINSAVLSGGSLEIGFTISGNASKALDIIAVVTDDTDRTNVRHGENGGRWLQHVSVARVLARVATVRGEEDESVRLSLPEGFLNVVDASHHLVLFAQEPHQGAILGAATRAL